MAYITSDQQEHKYFFLKKINQLIDLIFIKKIKKMLKILNLISRKEYIYVSDNLVSYILLTMKK